MSDIFVDIPELEKLMVEQKTRFAVLNMREGYSLLCRIPPALGFVTHIRQQRDRIVVETESGIEFIAPTYKTRG